MADDPFANFKPPGADDPFANYKSPPPPSTPWFSVGKGNDKIGEFVGKLADAYTGGLGAKALDAMGVGQGPNGQTVAKQIESAGQDIGPIASAGADLAGYALGPGQIGVGNKLATLMGGKLLARMGGSAAEGALTSGIGTLGHGGSLGEAGQAATVGGLLGGVTGALPGGRGPRPETPSPETLQKTAEDLYTPLKGQTQNASQIADAINNVTSGLDIGDAVAMGPKVAEMRDFISKELGNRQTVTSDSVAKLQRELKYAAGGDETKQAIVKLYTDALNKAVGPSAAFDIGAANRASNIAQTGAEIEGWAAVPSKAPAAIKSALENSPNFYKTPPGLFDALNKIGQKGGEPSLLTKLGDYAVRGAVGGGLGYGAGYVLGGNPGQSAIEGAMTGVIAPHVIKAAGGMPIKNALLAAQHLNATGVPVSPSVYTPQWLQIPGMLARQAGYAAGASGAL